MSRRFFLPLLSLALTCTMTFGVLLICVGPAAAWHSAVQLVQHSLLSTAESKKLISVGSTLPYPLESKPVTSYEIDAVLNPTKHEITGHEVCSIPSLPDSTLRFYLYSAASSSSPIHIQGVQRNLTDIPYSIEAGELVIPNLQTTQAVKLDIYFTTDVPASPTRFGVYEDIWSLDYWYPIVAVHLGGSWVPKPTPLNFGDPFLMDLANYTVHFRAPSSIHWYASTAIKQAKSLDAADTVTTWGPDLLRNFTLIGSPYFHERKFPLNASTSVSVVAQDETAIHSIFNITQQATEFYQSKFGPLSSPVLSVFIMPSGTVYAHEYPYLALLAKDTLGWSTGTHWLAHEIAHAWWFSEVGSYKALHPWLDEGLAEYSSILFEESYKGGGTYHTIINQDWRLFTSLRSYSPHSSGQPVDVGSLKMDRPYSDFQGDAAYYQLEYLRALLMYADLRHVMGDDVFFRFLKHYYEQNRQETASPASLVKAMQDISPANVPLLKLWMDASTIQLIETVKTRFQ